MKRLIIGLLLVLLVAGTVACAAPEWSVSAPAPEPAPTPVPAPMPPRGDGVSVEAPPPVIVVPGVAPVEGGPDYDGNYVTGDRMIIRTGNMYLVVEDVGASMEQITRLAADYDGFVVSSNVWQERDRMMANIAIRVTAEYFEDALRALRGMAVEVRSESTSGQDVTEEYVDLEARLHNLEATKVQLEKLLEKTEEKVTDILEVQRELSRVTGEIEQIKGRMQYLEQSVALSFIQINLEQSKLTVEFNANTRSVKEGEPVQFYPDISGGFSPYSYEWDFGDGTTSTDQIPSHAYKTDGSYTVKLKITDDRGNTDTQERTDYITVLPGWSAGNIVSGAWNGMVSFGRVLANILIWLGIFSPVWIIIGVILYFAWWRRRKKA